MLITIYQFLVLKTRRHSNRMSTTCFGCYWGYDVTSCLLPCSFQGVHNVTSYLVPYSFQGVCCLLGVAAYYRGVLPTVGVLPLGVCCLLWGCAAYWGCVFPTRRVCLPPWTNKQAINVTFQQLRWRTVILHFSSFIISSGLNFKQLKTHLH